MIEIEDERIPNFKMGATASTQKWIKWMLIWTIAETIGKTTDEREARKGTAGGEEIIDHCIVTISILGLAAAVSDEL